MFFRLHIRETGDKVPPVDTLQRILKTKDQEIEMILPLQEKLRAAALERNDFRSFKAALDRGPEQLAVIAEIKKASPSKGIIDPNFDPMKQFKLYDEGGASAVSILTDKEYFQGSLAYLSRISAKSTIPLIRKDFIIHEVQIFEAVVAGADAVLLIVAALDDATLKHLYDTAKSFQLDILVEVHDLPEMERALELGADIIGINNRNLRTFETDLATTELLADEVDADTILVSESGIFTEADAQRVLDAGANAILVGESLMREDIPQDRIKSFLELTATQ